MEKAASILGVNKVYYLDKKDFGYTFSPEETFIQWDKEDTLQKLVYFFRLVRPHIIITKHSKFNVNDHGQHQALAILAEEAFDLSGDPRAYPEMIKEGLLPWQPLKLYARAEKFSSEKDLVAIDTAENIFPETKTISQIATEALKQHSSQGDWQGSDISKPDKVFYKLVKSKVVTQNKELFFAGIKTDSFSGDFKEKQKEVVPSGIPGVKIVNNLKIGLMEKNHNVFFIALKTLGYTFTRLDENFLKDADFSQFDSIILGQGFSSSELHGLVNLFLKFVENGGNLIILCPYPKFLSFPYPLRISFQPITDANAPVTILSPAHPLFNFPNKISGEDFTDWRGEKGLCFPLEYSEQYTELTSCPSSQNKDTLIKSGYLVARYGKGSYILSTYSWHRQLREFQLGAYRNFANMLAYPYADAKN